MFNRRKALPASPESAKSSPAKSSPAKSGQASTGPAKSTATGQENRPRSADGFRETVESVVIAFVLAFLFRTFEAEAFVIPTGSMAPTLKGANKDLHCTKCGLPYEVSASDEVPSEDEFGGNRDVVDFRRYADRSDDELWKMLADLGEKASPRASRRTLLSMIREAEWKDNHRVVASVCPNCRYEMRFGPRDKPGGENPPKTYKGDRILVAKFPYAFADPERFDVAVFKYPEMAHQNFIKRIVGLPNETVVIRRGDIFARPAAAGPNERPTIQRKLPHKVQAMLQLVYDNDYPTPEMPARWQLADPNSVSDWQSRDEGRAFRVKEHPKAESWLVYQHLVPTPDDWRMLESGKIKPTDLARLQPQLITDFYAYNAGSSRRDANMTRSAGLYWVGDLALDCRVKVEGNEGAILLALVEAGRVFECRIDIASGKASLGISDDPTFEKSVETPIRGPGTWQVQLANVDDQLLLWIDGDALEFDGAYGPLANRRPTVEDLTPVRVGAQGGRVTFDHLRVLRDVYYIADRARAYHLPGAISEAERDSYRDPRFFSDPSRWADFDEVRSVEFPLGPDQFLVLGDNSPRSKDSRLWDARDESGEFEYYVKRELLIGKALYVYWPHALDHIPGTRIWFPLFPNFARMGLVR